MTSNSSFICPSPLVTLSDYSGGEHTTVLYAFADCVQPCPTLTFSHHNWSYMNKILTFCICITTPICALVLLSHARDFFRFYVRIMFIAGFFCYAITLVVFNVVNAHNNDVICASSSRFLMRGSLCIFQAFTIVWCFIWINTWSAILAVDTYLHVNLTLKIDSHDYMKSFYTTIGFAIPTIVTIIPLAANNMGYDPLYSSLLLITLGFTCACAYRIHKVLIASKHYKSYFAQRKPASRMIELGTSSESIDYYADRGGNGSSVFNIHYSSNIIEEKSPNNVDFMPRLSDQYAISKARALGPAPVNTPTDQGAASPIALFRHEIVNADTPSTSNMIYSDFDDIGSMNSEFARHYSDVLDPSRCVSTDDTNNPLNDSMISRGINQSIDSNSMCSTTSVAGTLRSGDDKSSSAAVDETSTRVMDLDHKVTILPPETVNNDSEVSHVDLLVQAAKNDLDALNSRSIFPNEVEGEQQGYWTTVCDFLSCCSVGTFWGTQDSSRRTGLRDTLIGASASLSINPNAQHENAHIINILRAVWLFNGRSMMMVIAYGINNLIGIPMLIVILATQFDAYLSSQDNYVNCLVNASLNSEVQTQDYINSYSAEVCGSHQENMPSYTLVFLFYTMINVYPLVPLLVFGCASKRTR